MTPLCICAAVGMMPPPRVYNSISWPVWLGTSWILLEQPRLQVADGIPGVERVRLQESQDLIFVGEFLNLPHRLLNRRGINIVLSQFATLLLEQLGLVKGQDALCEV